MRAQYPSILTLSLTERPQVTAPLLPALLMTDDPHLGLLLPIDSDPEGELGGLLELVGGAGEAPADNGRHTAGGLEGETGGGERQADQPHSGSDLGRSREANQTCSGERGDIRGGTPGLLCHKDTAQGTQSPLLGAFLAFRCVFMA